MKPESENLTARESLEIITAMIQEAKGNAQRNGFYFLLWGWVVVVANLGMFALTQMNYDYPYVVWVITIPAWIVSMVKGFRDGREQRVSTHFDHVSMWIWVCFGICVFTLVAFGYKLNYQLNPLIITISAIPTFVTGHLIRFKPLMFGGAALWVFGILAFLSPPSIQPLVGAAGIVCGYLVPAYLLRNKKHHNV